MKQRKRSCCILILAALLPALLAGCGQSAPGGSSPSPESQVIRLELIDEERMLTLADSGELYFVSVGDAPIVGTDGKSLTRENLTGGMMLDVTYDGSAMLTWPMQLTAEQIRVAERKDDLVGLYRQVLRDLWEEDPGLNDGVAVLGLDLGSLTNLTDGERAALMYVAGCDFGTGINCVSGTWEELCEQGYIDRENLYWEDGVLLSIRLEEAGKDSFTFTVEKWRSGLEAIWFTDCTASRGRDGRWSYEPGGFAIS